MGKTVEPLLTLGDVARLIGVSMPTLFRMLRRGDIPVIELGGRTLVEPADLRHFLTSRKVRRFLLDDDPAGTGSIVRTSGGGAAGRDPG